MKRLNRQPPRILGQVAAHSAVQKGLIIHTIGQEAYMLLDLTLHFQ
jgi:hypothetical protein